VSDRPTCSCASRRAFSSDDGGLIVSYETGSDIKVVEVVSVVKEREKRDASSHDVRISPMSKPIPTRRVIH